MINFDVLLKNKHFRNFLHILIGAGLGYLLSLTFNGITFFIQLFLTAFVVGGLGVFWEWAWKAYNKSEIDYYDVLRAVIPALIVVIISYFI